MSIEVGVDENALKVPLFAESYGYGPFKGRRNIGTPASCAQKSPEEPYEKTQQ